MKQIDETFAARLAAEVTTLCACWRFERRDGLVFGATDHDLTIAFEGVSYEPVAALAGATFVSSPGLDPGRVATTGALSLGFIEEADLAVGLWDGARVDVWRVDWEAPEHRVRVWSGRLSDIERRGESFAAELVSLKAGLERPVGRVYSRACDAEVGDARCGVDLAAPEFRGEGVVAGLLGAKRFAVTGLDAFKAGWFSGGVLTWSSGANASAGGRVARHVEGAIDLSAAPRFEIEPGDSFVVTAGCEKSFATCGAKFANRINFRGFPHMPGPEAVLAGPALDRVNDGGRR